MKHDVCAGIDAVHVLLKSDKPDAISHACATRKLFQLFEVIGFQSEQGSADYCQAQVGRPLGDNGQGANRNVLSFPAL